MIKNSNLILIGISAALILITSCSKTYIKEIQKNNNLTNYKSKSAVVVGFDGVNIREFGKTFYRKYRQNQEFVFEFAELFTSKLQKEKVFARVNSDKSPEWKLLQLVSVDNEQSKIIDSIFNNCNADYLICISEFVISNRIKNGLANDVNGNLAFSSKEYCIMKANFQIFDIKTRQKEVEFLSGGEGSVFLFVLETALTNAMNNTINHAVKYLKTGKTYFYSK